MRQRHAHPACTVVLVPYAQLMPWAQWFWAQQHPEGFVPRFETTRNWARQLQPFIAQGFDFACDPARDALTARALLDRAGLSAQRDMLAAPLMEAAMQLSLAVAAVPPLQRQAWGAQVRNGLPLADGETVLRYEAVVSSIALEWALTSVHATDVLFEPGVAAAVDAVVVLEGFQTDTVARALCEHWGEKALWMPLPPVEPAVPSRGEIALHECVDAEDEAQRAAACVLAHLQAGRAPVALAANDRALTRRIHAHLQSSGVAVRDENGWTLSTTRAAANTMAALHACAWDASTDTVLDWLKHCPAIAEADVRTLEKSLRQVVLARWSAVIVHDFTRHVHLSEWVAMAEKWRQGLQAARPLEQCLSALRALLESTGQWLRLQADAAGRQVLMALRLQDGQRDEVDSWEGAGSRMALSEFTRWAQEVMEAARFVPEQAPDATQVVILPLPQLLARPFAALVLPGCDEKRLQPSPEPPGLWTQVQRQALGLPTRESLEAAQRAAWVNALRMPMVDVLWRAGDEGGEPLLASAFVLALQLDSGMQWKGIDTREQRSVLVAPTLRPQPRGQALTVERLSSTAYSDLRHCPYRFFALRQLGLQDEQEMAAEVDKRDFGNWLHAVLQHFHEMLEQQPIDGMDERARCMDEAADAVTRRQGLDAGEFLPFAAGWPQLRDGYLRWLAQHEAQGAHFVQAEWRASQPMGRLQLVGTIDRIDAVNPTALDGGVLVIDYKTENGNETKKRIRVGTEDTQLAFYAALLNHGTLRAAYVNVGERGDTHMHEQHEVVALRDLLVEGIQTDFERIAQGAPLPALGEGAVCDYCAARGLCRKDFWG